MTKYGHDCRISDFSPKSRDMTNYNPVKIHTQFIIYIIFISVAFEDNFIIFEELCCSCADPENFVLWGHHNMFFVHQHISKGTVQTPVQTFLEHTVQPAALMTGY